MRSIFLYAAFPQHPRHAGNDQVGAFCFCAPFCFDGSDAGGSWLAACSEAGVDRCVHDFRAFCCDGFQPLGRCRSRRRESAHAHAGHSSGFAHPWLCSGVHDRDGRSVPAGSVETQPADPVVVARGACRAVSLLVHEAVYALVASFSGPGAGPRADRCVDRDSRLA